MNKKKHVLIISALDYWSMGKDMGGPALYQTLTWYAKLGWKVCFITGNCAHSDSEGLNENINIIRFDVPWLKRLMQIRKIGFFAKILWWIYFQIRAFIKAQEQRSNDEFDVVYGYEIFGVPVAKLLSILWRVPAVARFQGTSLGVAKMNLKLWRLIAWEHNIGLRIPMDLVIMTNDGTQGDQVLRKLDVNMERVRFWMNGVEWEPFASLPEKAEVRRMLQINAQYVLLTVSRLAYWKRVDREIQALPEVVRSFPDTILIVVGDGPERERLERLAIELGVREHVRFMGAVPQREVPKYLAAADIFLSLYDWSNVGNPLLEAMMARKCIVVLNNGDTGRLMQTGVNGMALEYEDLLKLPEVIKELLDDEVRRTRLGANARKFAEEHFWTWEVRMNAELAEVEMLIEKRFRGR